MCVCVGGCVGCVGVWACGCVGVRVCARAHACESVCFCVCVFVLVYILGAAYKAYL